MKASWEVAEALTLRAGERDLASAAPLATARVATTLVASRVRLARSLDEVTRKQVLRSRALVRRHFTMLRRPLQVPGRSCVPRPAASAGCAGIA